MSFYQLTDPAPIKSSLEQIYCRYCRGLISSNDQELRQGFHASCHIDVHAYSDVISEELAVIAILEKNYSEPIPGVVELELQSEPYGTFGIAGYAIENNRIIGLNLNGFNRKKLTRVPESIAQLTKLQTLFLSNNQLITLPETLGQLTDLRKLYLYNNQLNILPETLGQLTNLRELHLAGNQLKTFPETLGQLKNLETLYAGDNQLSILPESVCQLTNLRKLSLDGNQLTMIPEIIGQLTNLHTLSLHKNQLTLLPKSIRKLKNLNHLYLTGGNDVLGNKAKDYNDHQQVEKLFLSL